MTIPRSRLVAIRGRLDAATHGPWIMGNKVDEDECAFLVNTPGEGRLGYSKWTGAIMCASNRDDRTGGDYIARCNADFVSNSWQDIKDLLDEVERLNGTKEAPTLSVVPQVSAEMSSALSELTEARAEISRLKEIIRLLVK